MFRWTLKQLGYVKENEKDHLEKVETKSKNKNPNRRVSWHHLQSAWKLHIKLPSIILPAQSVKLIYN